MKNQIRQTTKQQYREIVKEAKGGSLYVGELDGAVIHDLDDFLTAVWVAFQFPVGYKSPDGYLDWIRDLTWLDAEGYIFAIFNFESFMDQDLHNKERIMRTLKDMVIPWWDSEVEKYCVEGKAKPFNVYLID